MEGIKASRAVGAGRHSLQSDPSVWPASGDCVRGGEVTLISPSLAASGLVQEGHGQGLCGRGRSWRAVCERRSYDYYKKFGYKTQVMGAASATSGEIKELAEAIC